MTLIEVTLETRNNWLVMFFFFLVNDFSVIWFMDDECGWKFASKALDTFVLFLLSLSEI